MFKEVATNVFEGSCPYCNNEAFVYIKGEKEMFLCHNCQRNIPYIKVKNANSSVRDRISSTSKSVHINFNSVLHLCDVLSSLPDIHPAVQYVRSRGFSDSMLDRVYYTSKFDEIGAVIGKQVAGTKRLVLPFFNENDELFGLQGRILEGEGPRYATLIFDENEDRFFGKNAVDFSKQFFCVEGPIDSLFLENAIAMAGVTNMPDKYKANAVICLDNEPRNKAIVKRMGKFLDEGFSVVIWPDSVKPKDVNDLKLSGYDPNQIVKDNVYSGLQGKIKLNQWKKV